MLRLRSLGLVICVALLALWAISIEWQIVCDWDRTCIALGNGGIRILWDLKMDWARRVRCIPGLGWDFFVGDPMIALSMQNWIPGYRSVPACKLINVHLWVLLAPVSVLTLFAYIRRPKQLGSAACHKCGYDLTGNVSGRCPECGTPCGGETRSVA